MVRDRQHDMLIDPSKVHEINFKGQYFDVPGPHMCEPSRQRTPVLYQAGASGRGLRFGARHAEAIFAMDPNIPACRAAIGRLTQALEAEGRRREDVKYFPGITVFVAPTDAEARLKFETCRRFGSAEGSLAMYCGWVSLIDPEREWSIAEIADYLSTGSLMPKIVGSPQTVADELERWMDETDCDGFNLVPVTQPHGFAEFADLVVPELQRRGRMRSHYEGETLREHYFGAGQQRLSEKHCAHRSLPPWKTATSREA